MFCSKITADSSTNDVLFNRAVILTTHGEYEVYREIILSRALVFFTNVKKKCPLNQYVHSIRSFFSLYLKLFQLKIKSSVGANCSSKSVLC